MLSVPFNQYGVLRAPEASATVYGFSLLVHVNQELGGELISPESQPEIIAMKPACGVGSAPKKMLTHLFIFMAQQWSWAVAAVLYGF